jgi:hypothetical protein
MTSDGEDIDESLEPRASMTVYRLVLKTRGSAWAPGESPELERLQAAHLAHLDEMRAEVCSDLRTAARWRVHPRCLDLTRRVTSRG